MGQQDQPANGGDDPLTRTVTGSFFPAVGPAGGDAALAGSRAVSRRIALIGDSIAYGRCTHDGGWAALVASRHIARDEENNRFFNLAWPGATMLEILDAAGAEVASRRADTVLVAAGINDLIHADGRGGAQVGRDVIARLESFCAAMESQGRRVVVMSPNWVDTTVVPGLHLGEILYLRETLRSWCEETFRDFLDTWDVLADRPGLFSDGLHPTAEGHRLLAGALNEGRPPGPIPRFYARAAAKTRSTQSHGQPGDRPGIQLSVRDPEPGGR